MKKNGFTLKKVVTKEQGQIFPVKCKCGSKNFNGSGIGCGLSTNTYWECRKCGATVETNTWDNRKLVVEE